MSKTIEANGACICGAVTLTATSVGLDAGACHCGTCRTWGGGPLMSASGGGDVVFTGEEHITTYNSSLWAERGFCSQCGTHLFYRLKQTGQYRLPCGLFGDDVPFEMDLQVFIDRKPEFYAFSNETKVMTSAEIFAMYGG